MKRAVIYNRVSTKEQKEHGYTLDEYHDRCREYAERRDFKVLDVISDSISGDKLARPGLEGVRSMIGEAQVDAVVVYSPDRLTRNLAHSLFLREELQKADAELHFYRSGKSEDTPEGRMRDNIEAVFSDYWKAKIVEGSRLGRRRKALSGKWVGDGRIPYGYDRVGQARDVHLEINEDEAVVVRRMFDMYIGADGRPMGFQGIAAALTAEGVPPPNRGTGGARKPSEIWHRATVSRLMAKPNFIGDFKYSGIDIALPELAIIGRETFDAAQKRRETSRARLKVKRKYEFLLAGHIRYSCGMGMSIAHFKQGRNRYYQCNSVGNKRHARNCTERMVRAPDAESITWQWVYNLICDDAKLEQGLSRLAELAAENLEVTQGQVDELGEEIKKAEVQIKRLTKFIGKTFDEFTAGELKAALDNWSHRRHSLVAERETILADIHAAQLSGADKEAIRAAAKEITHKMEFPTYEQKRSLFDARRSGRITVEE